MSPISMRVAHSDWCASRSVVSVIVTGRMADLRPFVDEAGMSVAGASSSRPMRSAKAGGNAATVSS